MASTNKRRFNKTLKMLKSIIPNGSSIFDLGVRNEFSEIMSDNGFKNYSKEWWHFTLKNEPYQKYFDFLIK